MKTKILFIALAIVCSSLGIASAQKEKSVYAVAISRGDTKTGIYISQVISSTMNKPGYINPQNFSFKLQWEKKLEMIDVSSTYLSWFGCDWNEDYEYVSKYREDKIYEYKKQGLPIHYVENFSFRQEK